MLVGAKYTYGDNTFETDNYISLINNRMGRARIDREAFEVGFKGWDWSMGSIQDPWYAGFHPRSSDAHEAHFLVE